MITFPNAKINIGLNITERRTDGYHNIETIFYPISLSDVLEIEESKNKNYTLIIKGLELDSNIDNNLITKAYNLFKKEFDIPAVNVHFEKIIPFGAGLGGGSADAAFMLKSLNEIFKLQISDDTLEKYASQIGADCPFFIKNKPVFASGTGNKFTNINFSLKGYYITLIKPNIYIPTKEAYSGVKPQKSAYSLKNIITEKSIAEWKNYVQNDFEKTVFSKFPLIGKIKNELYNRGALYASMSGSGSSVYGIFKEQSYLKNLFPDCFVWSGEL
jgi:4-diphosphocytidyl-2-C-methyl-D-erythritol kinase